MTLEDRMTDRLARTSAGNELDRRLARSREEALSFLEGLACGLAAPHEAPLSAAQRVLSAQFRGRE